MPFEVSEKVLERLEWPQILSKLREQARTPRARSLCGGPGKSPENEREIFETGLPGVLERLEETDEARRLLDAGEDPPLAGVHGIEASLSRAAKGGILSPRELLDLLSTIDALDAVTRFLARCEDDAPRLAELASAIQTHPDLAARIGGALDPEGQVRDDASPLLAAARAETRRLSAELERRLERSLHDPDLGSYLSDRFVTVRNDRYVLPVRADSRGRVRGIVHDVSSSGTTLFIEPEAVVDLNNRLKQAELQVEREIVRILRDLSAGAAQALPTLDASLATLEAIDLAFARGHLSQAMDAQSPQVKEEGVLDLPDLRHPLLDPKEVVENDVRLGADYTVLVISGPNAGGKTVAMKAAALAVLLVRAGMHVPASPGARIDLFDRLLADIGDEQDLARNLSTFSAHMENQAQILDTANERSLVVLDEVGTGTDPSEGAALAQALLETLADAGARVVATTHYNLLKEMADVDPRFANASVEFDPATLAPTYRLHLGVPGSSSALAVAARTGVGPAVLERARGLLEGEDRRLDRMLSDLGDLRATLEQKGRELSRQREETDALREEYEEKLRGLRTKRDRTLGAMGRDLENAFRQAKAELAAVVRDVQRGRSGQAASHARERLLGLEERTREARLQAEQAMAPPLEVHPVDWTSAQPGDRVVIRGGRTGVLLELPDRRRRVPVRVGSARLVLPADQLSAPDSGPGATNVRTSPAAKAVHDDLRREEAASASLRCDLRGQRVDEALERLVVHLDRAAVSGANHLFVIHGLGSGALRNAVREYLASSPYVGAWRDADPSEGGDGVTVVEF